MRNGSMLPYALPLAYGAGIGFCMVHCVAEGAVIA
jgi:hypothetical protein